jgi:hypothetical protein
MKAIYAIAIATFIGCSNTPAPRAPSENAPASSGTTAAAVSTTVEPNKAKAVSHFKEHVKYPASRGEILAACAQTPEFTAGEKEWLAQHLPEGTYKSPDDVVGALHL